jgi:hypothetical protein
MQGCHAIEEGGAPHLLHETTSLDFQATRILQDDEDRRVVAAAEAWKQTKTLAASLHKRLSLAAKKTQQAREAVRHVIPPPRGHLDEAYHARHSTTQRDTTLHNTTQHNTAWHNTTQHDTTQHLEALPKHKTNNTQSSRRNKSIFKTK